MRRSSVLSSSRQDRHSLASRLKGFEAEGWDRFLRNHRCLGAPVHLAAILRSVLTTGSRADFQTP
jgi:hypothetical protein